MSLLFRLTQSDALDCCPNDEYIPCDGGFGCVDHPQAEEYCPGNENLKRMGGEFGYISDSPLTYDRAIQYCVSNQV